MIKKITKKALADAYVERDLSWMYFNRRILQEAEKPRVPLLERLSFLGIYSNNLDEFFRVRMATLSRIAECEDNALRRESKQAQQLIGRINKLNAKYVMEYEAAIREVTRLLREENIFLLKETELDEEQQAFVRRFFYAKLSSSISPVWLSAVRQLTEEADDNIYMAVRLRTAGKKKHDYALIALPVAECGRFLRLPDREGKSYLMYLDDVVRYCLPMVFAGLGYEDFSAYAFKFTKDAEMEIDNDLRNSLMQKISKGVKSRKKGDALRVIYDAEMPKEMVHRVMEKLNLDKLDTVLSGGRYHNHKDLMTFPDCGRTDLKYPAWPPIVKAGLENGTSLLAQVQAGDRFIHVPYHSFDYYIRLLQEAAISLEVKSIRTTLYRLAKDSKVVKALICAASARKWSASSCLRDCPRHCKANFLSPSLPSSSWAPKTFRFRQATSPRVLSFASPSSSLLERSGLMHPFTTSPNTCAHPFFALPASAPLPCGPTSKSSRTKSRARLSLKQTTACLFKKRQNSRRMFFNISV